MPGRGHATVFIRERQVGIEAMQESHAAREQAIGMN